MKAANGFRPLLLVSALLLAACAQLPEHREPEDASLAAIDVNDADTAELVPAAAFASIPVDELHAAMTRRRDGLQALLKPQIAQAEIVAPVLHGEQLRTDWRSDALFEAHTAELRPQALRPLSRVAKWLRADGATVLQVVGQQTGADRDDLAARRAAAVAAFVIAEGALAPRVRVQVIDLAQLRATAANAADADLRLVVMPVVVGREALAWIPPAVD